jgi:hypothetical protein
LTPLEQELVKPEIQDRLFKMAFGRVRHPQAAEDLVQTTAAASLAREQRGNGWTGPPPPILDHLGSVMNGELSNERKKRRPTIVEGETEKAPSASPHAEGWLLRNEEEHEMDAVWAQLRAHFAALPDGRIAVALMDALGRGLRGAEALATEIGCEAKEIYVARRRIVRQRDRIRAKAAGADAEAEALS